MRLLLTLMATAVLAVSLGCDSKPDAKKPESTATGGGAAAVEAPAAGSDKKADGASATANTKGTQKVSLKLPGMT